MEKFTEVAFSPQRIHMDCELVPFNIFKEIFPTADILLCLFHLTQSFRRKLWNLGFKNKTDHCHSDYCVSFGEY